MAYWLFKSEPETWSFAMQKKKGKAGQEWDGVRNYQARNHMRAMAVGDRGFFYHSGDEKAVVGIVEIVKEAHPDSTDEAWECVDIRAVADMPEPVTLETIKATKSLERNGAGEELAALGAAGQRGGMEDDLQDGRARSGEGRLTCSRSPTTIRAGTHALRQLDDDRALRRGVPLADDARAAKAARQPCCRSA